MNFSTPPSLEDLQVIAETALESLPEELMTFCEDLAIAVEEFADSATEAELDLDDPYDLPCLYKKGGQIAPGVTKKQADEDDVLMIYRRPVLDLWCESYDDLSLTIRSLMIAEIGQAFDFSDDEIEEMTDRHFQGLL